MRKRLFLSILLLSFQLLIAGTTILENDKVKSAISLYETWLNAQMEYRGIPGCSFAIIYDQDLIYSKGYGFSDLEKQIPASPETVYRIASITKTFTSTAILQLRDEGKLQLDDPVTKYLPWFEIRNNFKNYPEITIWHILTHTSGLPGEAAYPYWTDHIFPTVEQIKEALPNQEMIYPCETKWNYSNLAMSLLGYVVEEASDKKYAKYIEKNIL